jgi:hypothetical protein
MTITKLEDADASALMQDVVSAMGGSVEAPWDADLFDALALRAFRHQFEGNRPFRAYCESRGTTPDSVRAWAEVPVVPVAAFKALELVVGPAADVDTVFRTSGTTTGGGSRGAHFVPDLAVYEASLLPAFRRRVVPDVERLPFVSLIPSPGALEDSSLSYMVGAASEHFGSEVTWVVDGHGRWDLDALDRALRSAERSDGPVLLLGTAFAFVHALEQDPPVLRRLPAGSRIMDTGGFKGRSRELPKQELHALLTDRTGVPRERIVNEYGMTELLSQLYEPVLAEGVQGADRHVPPPWLKVRALDPATLEALGEGEEGILAFFDLANVGSVCHILTEDVGSVTGGRVHLVGRSAGAEPRGCSRAMDELMSAAR